MLSVDDALERILSPLNPVSEETVPLEDAFGRTLREKISARRTQPPKDVSAMDGYAVHAADIADIPCQLKIAGEAPAGGAADISLDPGEAVRIFTGGIVPPGADTVILQEDTSREKDIVTILERPRRGQHIRRSGIDFTEGDTPLAPGHRLHARDIGLIASMNVTSLVVSRKPVVGILATGDELVPPGDDAADHQIVSSTPYALAAYLSSWGAEPRLMGIARDTPESLVAKIDDNAGLDFLVTIGGASVGDHDLIQKVLAGHGLEVDFWKVAMKPGKPILFGRYNNIPMLGLPGNPVSSIVCALLFLKPAIGVLLGTSKDQLKPSAVRARLTCALSANRKRQDYMRATVKAADDGELEVTPFDLQDSSVMSVLARANALLIRPPNAAAAAVGEHVPVLLLD